MKNIFALVIDRFDRTTGIKTFYEDLLLFCENREIPVLLITDSSNININSKYVTHKYVKEIDSCWKHDKLESVRPRPFLAFNNNELSIEDQIKLGKVVSDLSIKHKIKYDKFVKLDAFQDYSFFASLSNIIGSWINELEINKVYIATQSFLGFSAIQLKDSSNKKYIIHFHTDYPEFYFQRITKNLRCNPPSYYNVLKKSMYTRIASHFICPGSSIIFPSKYFFNKMKPYIKNTKYSSFILNSGVSIVKQEMSKTCSMQSKGPREIILLYVGRLEHDKNIELLVKIDTSIISKRLNVVWWIVGEGSLLDYLRRNLHNARFLGKMERGDLSRIYKGADYLIFPSIYDTCGKTVLEAMASRLPVVLTNKGGPASFLINGKHAFLCKPIPNDFIDAILFYESNPQQKKAMIENAHLAVKKYDSDKINKKLVDIIMGL